MTDQLSPFCKDQQQRRADLLAHPDPALNGVDYLEVDAADHRIIRIFFLRDLPPDPIDPTRDAYGLSADITRISITGGIRVVGINVVSASRQVTAQHPEGFLEVRVDQGGDYSIYALTLSAPDLDEFLSHLHFSFMAGCPVDADCRQPAECPPEELNEPLLDYLAKDYSSFRRLMLDLVPQLNPQFTERNPADLGIALIELLAYHGDQLSYFQDAVANEAFLDTCRQRISARRHARLVDYRMHDGRNAWTYVHLVAGAAGSLPQGTRVLSRISAPLIGDSSPPLVEMDGVRITAQALERDPALSSAVVFETTHRAVLDPRNNEILIHAWGNEECCRQPGALEAHVFSVDPVTGVAGRPPLHSGDFLLIEEVCGPRSGVAADADPTIRQVVQLAEEPEPTGDGLYLDTLARDALGNWQLQRAQAAQPELPLLRVTWRRADALRFPFCLSSRPADVGPVRNVSVARGNIVLADHGLTVREAIPAPPPGRDDQIRLRLSRGPLTRQCEPPRMEFDAASGSPLTARLELTCESRDARPAVHVLAAFPTGSELWTGVPDLLESPPFAQHFVAEADDDGRATLRFGDGEYGRQAAGAVSFEAIYRIGNGRAGNVGAESLAHVAPLPLVAGLVRAVRNPLPAEGGVDPETIEEVRQRAPEAFRAEQFRAVTEADYVTAARGLPEVAGAVASFRWTGSWYTVFVGVDPRDPADLLTERTGRLRLAPALESCVSAFLTRYRLAGYDMELRAPVFVPLEVELAVCAAPGHFRTDVAAEVTRAMSARTLPDGRRGFFHPDHWTFGQPVYLSQIYAAVERVEGVDSLVVTRFRRYGRTSAGELAAGVLPIGPWEIAQLENDPNFLERGVLRVVTSGGKA